MRQITHLDKYGLPSHLRDMEVELEVCSDGLAQLAVHQRLVQVQHQRLLCAAKSSKVWQLEQVL